MKQVREQVTIDDPNLNEILEEYARSINSVDEIHNTDHQTRIYVDDNNEAHIETNGTEKAVIDSSMLNVADGFKIGSGDNYIIYDDTNDKIQIYTASTERVVVDSTGVGIGTSPAWKFQVQESSSSKVAQFGGATNTRIRLNTPTAGSYADLFARDDTALTFEWGGSELVRFEKGGNVGIGKNPSYKLDVNGKIESQGTFVRDTRPRTKFIDSDSTKHDTLLIEVYDNEFRFIPVDDDGYRWGDNFEYLFGMNKWRLGNDLLVDGTIEYHALSDITCANLKEYSDNELSKLLNLQPRKDDIYHKSNPNSKAFPHIDFSQVHDDIAVITEQDEEVDRVYKYDEKKKDYIKTKIKYKKGEKYGIDFGTLVYAIAEVCIRQQQRIESLEAKIAK